MPNIIWIPKPMRTAYNPDRPLEKNALIQAQVEHFHEAEMNLPPISRTGIDTASIRTEGEAAKYVAAVTKALHQRGTRPKPKVEKA